VANDVAAPAPPMWLIQRNLVEIENRDRAIHLRPTPRSAATSNTSSNPWVGYQAEPFATGEFVFDQPPPSHPYHLEKDTRRRFLFPPKTSPPRGAQDGRRTAASSPPRRNVTTNWAACDMVVEGSNTFEPAERLAPPQSQPLASAVLRASTASQQESVTASRDQLFASMVLGFEDPRVILLRAPHHHSGCGGCRRPICCSAQSASVD
jgi:hypothetical protein